MRNGVSLLLWGVFLASIIVSVDTAESSGSSTTSEFVVIYSPDIIKYLNNVITNIPEAYTNQHGKDGV